MTNLTHISFLCIYFNSLRVSSNLVLIIRRLNCINTTSGIRHSVSVTVSCAGRTDLRTKRSPTQGDIYQRLYWYNWFSWRWVRGCSKHAENWNKYIEKNCVSIWSFAKNHKELHGQQNIKYRIVVCFICWLQIKVCCCDFGRIMTYTSYPCPSSVITKTNAHKINTYVSLFGPPWRQEFTTLPPEP